MKVSLTVVIPTLNEESQIAECVHHVRWANEVIVADAGSVDRTVELARAAGARVLEHTGPTIAAQRNAAIGEARTEWVFALDADERVPDALRDELAGVIACAAHPVYKVRRRNLYLGRELKRGHWGKDWVTRLFTRERRWIDRRVHEHLERVPNPGLLANTLEHHSYRDFSHHLEKIERYGRWGALDLYDEGRRSTAVDLMLRPLARFFRDYLVLGYCLDGRFGLVTASLGAYGVFLKYAHLWALERRP